MFIAVTARISGGVFARAIKSFALAEKVLQPALGVVTKFNLVVEEETSPSVEDSARFHG